MKLIDRVDSIIDYSNGSGVKRVIGILESEFSLAVKHQDPVYARDVILVAETICDRISNNKSSKDIWGRKLKSFVEFLYATTKKEFG